jgi:hypothetical protein
MPDNTKALKAIQTADFDWVTRLNHVWRDGRYDVPEIHASLRQTILDGCRGLSDTSPLGRVILGPAGAGKTHLLGSLRREAPKINTTFILVDGTNIRDFRETVLLGYMSSLKETEHEPQGLTVLEGIFHHLGLEKQKAARNTLALVKAEPTTLATYSTKVIEALARRHPHNVSRYQDVIRALILFQSNHFALSNLGYLWLQGLPLEPSEASAVGIRQINPDPIHIIEGLSWIISLRGPTILALDQLDAIVSEKYLAFGLTGSEMDTDQGSASRAIVENLGRGLSSLIDHTYRTLCLVSCLESTWEILRRTTLGSNTDRYAPPDYLRPLGNGEAVVNLVAKRLRPAYERAGFVPAYPTWPFAPQALAETAGLTPREVLKICARYQHRCLETKRIEELVSLSGMAKATGPTKQSDERDRIDRMLADLKKEPPPEDLFQEDGEQPLGQLIQLACRLLVLESPLPDDMDILLETRFGGGKTFAPLHVRLSLVYARQGAEETHFCYRVLQKTNASAFQARLKAAMTAAGIDQRLGSRRLFIIRTTPLPSGPKSKEIIDEFHSAGGRFLEINPDEITTLNALSRLKRSLDPGFEDWLQDRKPISKLGLIRKTVIDTWYRPDAGLSTATGNDDPPADHLGLGRSLKPRFPGQRLTLPASALAEHAMVLADERAGKSALIQRLVQEAALQGIPSLVVDMNGHLSDFGRIQLESQPRQSGREDYKTKRLGEKVDFMMWAPGLPNGRKLRLSPWLPVGTYADISEDLLNLAFHLVLDDALGDRGSHSTKKRGVLAAAIRRFARENRGGFQDFIHYLNNPATENSDNIRAASRIGRDMSARLLKMVSWLGDVSGTDSDSILPIEARSDGRVPISIVSTAGLKDVTERRRLVRCLIPPLVESLWRLPAPEDGHVRALLVINEVRHVWPAKKGSHAANLMTVLAKIGRHAGLGLLLGSEFPQDIDLETDLISTWFHGPIAGRNGRVARKRLERLGGSGREWARLEANQFFVTSTGNVTSPELFQAGPPLTVYPDQPDTDPEGIPLTMKTAVTSGTDHLKEDHDAG